MRHLVMLAFAVGCSGKGSEPDPSPAPAPSPSAPSADAAPRTGIARASRPSRPKAEWPCAVRFKNTSGEIIVARMEYAPIDHCEVPINLLNGTLGGCPTNAGGTKFTYDATGRVIKANYDYTWGSGGLIRESISQTVRDYGERGGDIVMGDPHDPENVIQLDAAGRPVTLEQYGAGGIVWTDTLEYDGERIVRDTHVSRSDPAPSVREILYDCSKLAP